MSGEEVVRSYSDMIYKVAYRYVRNPYDAEDVLSETFLTYFKKEREFESEEHLRAWLIRVTINAAKDFLTKRSDCEEINEELAGEEDKCDALDSAMDLRSAMEQLPAHQREVVTLFYLQDLSVQQIAEILGKNKNTVTVTLFRARENLRRFLE